MSETSEQLERAICGLEYVQAARVVTGNGGRITEVHVVADPTHRPKQIVRDVETLALARFGIDVDHRVVSVVCMDPVHTAPAPIDDLERG